MTGFERRQKKKNRLQKAGDRDKGGGSGGGGRTVQDVERDLFGEDEGEDEDEDEGEAKPDAGAMDKAAAKAKKKASRAAEEAAAAGAKGKAPAADLDEDESEDEFADFIDREGDEAPRRKLKSHMPGVVRGKGSCFAIFAPPFFFTAFNRQVALFGRHRQPQMRTLRRCFSCGTVEAR